MDNPKLPAKTNANHNNTQDLPEVDTKLIPPYYSVIMYYVPSLKIISYLNTKNNFLNMVLININ